MSRNRSVFAIVVLCAAVLLGGAFWYARSHSAHLPLARNSSGPPLPPSIDDGATALWAHNIRLRKGPKFRVYVVWIRGLMLRADPGTIPSLDALDSFIFDIQKGVIHVDIGDLADYLNAVSATNAPLKKISIEAVGDQLKVHGILKKVVDLPVEITGALSALPTGEVRFHPSKISVLKVPMKGLLGLFHVHIDDFISDPHMPGIRIVDNDIVFDTSRLLPPPHIRGQLTAIRTRFPYIEAVYGDAGNDEAVLAQWHNFLRLSGGTLNFGAFTMHHADLTMIDVNDSPWFGLDLAHYQSQLTKGYARFTPTFGIEAYMPDLDQPGAPVAPPAASVDTLRNRRNSIPGQVTK